MKRIKFLSMLFLAVSAMAFVSCDTDDDDKSLSPAEVQTCYNAVKGSYSGKLIYQAADAGSNTAKNDTLAVSWEINTDSTMIIRNFPSKAIATAITDSALSKNIAEMPAQDIKCYIGFVRVSPVQWLINPVSLTYDNVPYKDGSKVQVIFYVNNYYSFGAFNSSNNAMQMQIVSAGVYIDGKFDSSLMKAKAFAFIKQ